MWADKRRILLPILLEAPPSFGACAVSRTVAFGCSRQSITCAESRAHLVGCHPDQNLMSHLD